MAIGKRVGEHVYVHVSTLAELDDPETATLIAQTLALIPDDTPVNVAKVHLRTRAVSLLHYAAFETAPFFTSAPKLKSPVAQCVGLCLDRPHDTPE